MNNINKMPLTLSPAKTNISSREEGVQTKSLYFNKTLSKIKPKIAIKINEFIKSNENVDITERVCQRQLTLTYIPLEIKGKRFEYINGNSRDDLIVDLLHETESDVEVQFDLVTSNGNYMYIPNIPWQKRFIDIINNGMDTLSNQGARSTCEQFVDFIEFGKKPYSAPMRINVEFTTKVDFRDDHVILALFSNDSANPSHLFIHIGNGVCLSKIGERNIYFHTIVDIKSFYEDICCKPLKLAKLKYQSIEDF